MQLLEKLQLKKIIKASEQAARVAPGEYESWLSHPLTISLLAHLEARQLQCMMDWPYQLTQDTVEKTALETARWTATSLVLQETTALIREGLTKREESETETVRSSDSSEARSDGEEDR
jgi:hypothetical protein